MSNLPYKLFVSDIDGTLTDVGSFDVPTETRSAIERLKAHGVIFVLATGRSPSVAKGEYVGFVEPDYLISGNGSRIVAADGTPLFESLLDEEDMAEILEFAEKTDGCLAFSFADGYYFYHNYDKIRERVGWNSFCEACYFDCSSRDHHLSGMPQSALMVLKKEQEPLFMPKNGSLLLLEFAENLYDIVRDDVTKGHAVKRLLDSLSLTWEDAAVIGDSENDIPMFLPAGYSIAMGNALDEIKAVCDYVCEPVSQLGLVKTINRIYGV